ncbi:MAG: gamma-glutamyltransferase [Holosporales bacterium]|jgi:gamma-glutamyltranspeptidase/glutathione hydrolase
MQYNKSIKTVFCLAVILALLGCTDGGSSGNLTAAHYPIPEDYNAYNPQPEAKNKRQMVVTSHPLATKAALDILARGGNAMDAAIAAQAMLTVVEPYASGIGGGGFLMYYDPATKKTILYDGREVASQAATPNKFLDKNGKPLPFYAAVTGAGSVGVPGLLAMLDFAHKSHGKLQWHDLFIDAAQTAEEGFVVNERLATLVKTDPYLASNLGAQQVYFPGGNRIKTGETLHNPALAETLRRVAINGPREVYANFITDRIMAALNNHSTFPSRMTINDFVDYKALRRTATCGKYRVWTICSASPPSSGGIAMLQTLKLLEKYNLAELGKDNPQSYFLITEASKLAFADRDAYIADPQFVKINYSKLLDKRYLEERGKIINQNKSLGTARPGKPDASFEQYAAVAQPNQANSTTHISVVDSAGRAISLTSSLEDAWGSRIVVDGFALNSQLTDFAFEPQKNGKPVANRVEAGKRPRSSMSPTFVFDKNGQLQYILGTPGGSRIIPYTVQAVVALLDWKQSAGQVVTAGHVVNRNGTTELEAGGRVAPEIAAALRARGQEVVFTSLPSGMNIIERTKDGWVGATDPRREGLAAGQ